MDRRNISLQALDKVKVEYEIVNGKLAIITPDRYDDFIPYEPLSQVFGLTNWDERFKKMVLEDLRKNLSVSTRRSRSTKYPLYRQNLS